MTNSSCNNIEYILKKQTANSDESLLESNKYDSYFDKKYHIDANYNNYDNVNSDVNKKKLPIHDNPIQQILKDRICYNPITGQKSDDCKYVTLRTDYIDPNKGWFCQDKTGKKYFSKRQCNHMQLKDKSVVYKKKFNPSMHPIEDDYKYMPEYRKWTRFRLLIFIYCACWLIIFTLLNKALLGKATKYILWLLFSLIIVFVIIFLFCPFGLCLQDPDMIKFRRNPESYIHKFLCNFAYLTKFPMPGCNEITNICTLTGNWFPSCWKKNAYM